MWTAESLGMLENFPYGQRTPEGPGLQDLPNNPPPPSQQHHLRHGSQRVPKDG